MLAVSPRWNSLFPVTLITENYTIAITFVNTYFQLTISYGQILCNGSPAIADYASEGSKVVSDAAASNGE